MSSANVPPGPDGLARYRNLLRVIRDQRGFHRRLCSTYGDVSSYQIFDDRLYLLSHPDHVRDVLMVDDGRFKKPHLYRDDPVFGEGIVAVEGENWQRQRNAVGQTIRRDVTLDRTEAIVACLDDVVGSWSQTQRVSLTDTVSEVVLRILSHVLYGSNEEYDIDRVETSLVGLQTDAPVWSRFLHRFFPSLPNPTMDQWREDRRTHLRELEAAVLEATDRQEPDSEASGLVSLLLAAEQQGRADRDEIRDQLVTMLFTGYGNPVTMVTYALVRLAADSQLQSRLRTEAEQVVDGGTFDEETLSSLESTEWYLREILRLYPPAPAVNRVTTSAVEVGEYTIPEGAQVKVPLWLIHRDERFWERPNAFDLDRWKRRSSPPAYRYAPFGAGLRKCPAKDLFYVMAKVVLAEILQRFRLETQGSVELTPGANLPDEPDHDVAVTPIE